MQQPLLSVATSNSEEDRHDTDTKDHIKEEEEKEDTGTVVVGNNNVSVRCDDKELRSMLSNQSVVPKQLTVHHAAVDSSWSAWLMFHGRHCGPHVAATLSAWYQIYVGYSLLFQYDQRTSGFTWFGFMVVGVVFSLMLLHYSILSNEHFSTRQKAARYIGYGLCEVLFVSKIVYWCMFIQSSKRLQQLKLQRDKTPDNDVDTVEEETMDLQIMLVMNESLFIFPRLVCNVLPLLGVSVYQSLLVMLVPQQAGGRHFGNVQKFLAFQVSTIVSVVSAMKLFYKAELAKGEQLLAKDPLEWVELMNNIGLPPASRWRRVATIVWRAISSYSRLLSVCLYIVAATTKLDASDSSTSTPGTTALISYISIGWLWCVFFYDGSLKDLQNDMDIPRSIRPPGWRANVCKCERYNLTSLGIVNMFVPVETTGAFFPMPNTFFRLGLVVMYEAASFVGLFFGHWYCEEHKLLQNSRASTLFTVITIQYIASLLCFLLWILMQRAFVWPLKFCC